VKTRLAAVSLGLAIAATLFLLVWPVYTGSDGSRTIRTTLIQMNGPWIIVPVMMPVVVALLPVLFRKQAVRISAAVVIGAFSFIAMSIGLFYMPAAIMMLLAACVSDGAS